MYRIIPVVVLALGMAVSLAAQDTTVTTRTTVSGDDARALSLTGCLERGPAGIFTLNNATARSSEVTTRTKVETDVDDDGDNVKTKSRTEVEHDNSRRTDVAGLKTSYELTPRQGVELASHVGQHVQITAVALAPKDATTMPT